MLKLKFKSKIVLLISMILNLNCFYSLSAKKRNRHSHFKYIKKNKIIAKSGVLSAIMLLSLKKLYFLLNSINIPLCYVNFLPLLKALENEAIVPLNTKKAFILQQSSLFTIDFKKSLIGNMFATVKTKISLPFSVSHSNS